MYTKEKITNNALQLVGLAAGGIGVYSAQNLYKDEDKMKRAIIAFSVVLPFGVLAGVPDGNGKMDVLVRGMIQGATAGCAYLAAKKIVDKANGASGIGLVGDRTFRYKTDPHDPKALRLRIYAYEPYFGKDVWVGVLDYDKREVSPTHGYFYPHKYGKLMKKMAEEMRFTFNNN